MKCIPAPFELVEGNTYRGKTPRNAGGRFNDRTVTWIDKTGTVIEYAGPAVDMAKPLPKVNRDAFVKWAARDVTEQSKGQYENWPAKKSVKL